MQLASGMPPLGLQMTLCMCQPGAGLVHGDGASSPQDVAPATNSARHSGPSSTFQHPTVDTDLDFPKFRWDTGACERPGLRVPCPSGHCAGPGQTWCWFVLKLESCLTLRVEQKVF